MTERAQKAQEILKAMTLKEKVGQLFMLAFPGKNIEVIYPLLDTFGIGGCYLCQDNATTFKEAQQLSRALYSRINKKRNFDMQMILGVDQEGAWGVLCPESTVGPGNLSLGVQNDTTHTFEVYSIFSQEMKRVGFNTILAPCADVNLDPQNPIIGMRSFGENAECVSNHVVSAIKGIKTHKIFATAKHFPGHGDTHSDTHREIPTVNKPYDELIKQELRPFIAAVSAGVDFIMTAHILFPEIDTQNPATLSPKILTELLRNTLKFDGLIITDSMNMGAMRKFYGVEEATTRAVLAGADIIMLSEEHYDHSEDYLSKQIISIESVIHAVEDGRIPERLLDEKVFRIIKKKLEIDIREMFIDVDEAFYEEVASHRKKTVSIATDSIMILRNEYQLLPIENKNNIAVIRSSPQRCFANLLNSRGIGPNQEVPASRSVTDFLPKSSEVYLYEDVVDQLDVLNKFDLIIAITEDYPLPGEDFEKKTSAGIGVEFDNTI